MLAGQNEGNGRDSIQEAWFLVGYHCVPVCYSLDLSRPLHVHVLDALGQSQ